MVFWGPIGRRALARLHGETTRSPSKPEASKNTKTRQERLKNPAERRKQWLHEQLKKVGGKKGNRVCGNPGERPSEQQDAPKNGSAGDSQPAAGARPGEAGRGRRLPGRHLCSVTIARPDKFIVARHGAAGGRGGVRSHLLGRLRPPSPGAAAEDAPLPRMLRCVPAPGEGWAACCPQVG